MDGIWEIQEKVQWIIFHICPFPSTLQIKSIDHYLGRHLDFLKSIAIKD